MPAREHIVQVGQEWMAKAENDLRVAAYILKLGAKSPADTACFHAQQCVEKYLKALLTLEMIPFPKMHDLQVLIELIPTTLRPRLSIEEQRRLTSYATVTRYPGDYEPISLAEARQALALARRSRKEIRQQINKVQEGK